MWRTFDKLLEIEFWHLNLLLLSMELSTEIQNIFDIRMYSSFKNIKSHLSVFYLLVYLFYLGFHNLLNKFYNERPYQLWPSSNDNYEFSIVLQALPFWRCMLCDNTCTKGVALGQCCFSQLTSSVDVAAPNPF